MLVFIDYDNVDALERQRGVRHVVELVLSKLDPSRLPQGTRVQVRLYGGWYERARLSRYAQRIAAEISRDFPAAITLTGPSGRQTLRATVELARSLSIDPGRDLLHTYRLRGVPPNLRPRRLPFSGCVAAQACPLQATHGLLQTGQCIQSSCNVTIADVMTRPEQKLVDTMLTADLIHAASSAPADLTIVSTDDDLWPGIRTAVYLGARIHHVHPVKNRQTPSHYASAVTANYHQYCF